MMGFTNPGRFVLKKLMLEEVQKQVEFLFLLYYNTNRRTESAPHLWCDVTAQCTFPLVSPYVSFFPATTAYYYYRQQRNKHPLLSKTRPPLWIQEKKYSRETVVFLLANCVKEWIFVHAFFLASWQQAGIEQVTAVFAREFCSSKLALRYLNPPVNL